MTIPSVSPLTAPHTHNTIAQYSQPLLTLIETVGRVALLMVSHVVYCMSLGCSKLAEDYAIEQIGWFDRTFFSIPQTVGDSFAPPPLTTVITPPLDGANAQPVLSIKKRYEQLLTEWGWKLSDQEQHALRVLLAQLATESLWSLISRRDDLLQQTRALARADILACLAFIGSESATKEHFTAIKAHRLLVSLAMPYFSRAANADIDCYRRWETVLGRVENMAKCMSVCPSLLKEALEHRNWQQFLDILFP